MAKVFLVKRDNWEIYKILQLLNFIKYVYKYFQEKGLVSTVNPLKIGAIGRITHLE